MSRRTKKVESLLMSELSILLLQEISDPALQNISLLEVQVTDDLKTAHIYFTVRGEGAPAPKVLKDIEKGFVRATPFLKRSLGKALELRTIPDLEFTYDDHLNEVTRVMSLLESVKQVKGQEQGACQEQSAK